MTPSCTSLKGRDSIAATLCGELVRGGATSLADLKRGISRIDYRAVGALPTRTPRNTSLDPVAVYQAYLETSLTRDMSQRASRLFARRFGVRNPWIPDPRHSILISKALSRAEREATAARSTGNSRRDATFLRANALLHAITAPRSAGGLGLRYEDHDKEDVDINGAIDRGFIACSEFQIIYCFMARRMGLKAFPIECPEDDLQGRGPAHAAVMIVDPSSGKRYFSDIIDDDVSERPPMPEYYVGTAADIFAHHLFNRSLISNSGEFSLTKKDSAPIVGATAVSPYNATALFGLSLYHLGRGEQESARRTLNQTLEVRPNHFTAWVFLCTQDAGGKACAQGIQIPRPELRHAP